MKNNIDYYRHETNSHNHPKFKTLRVKYGWEGEGRFWALNNIIAESEDCILDLSKNYNKSSIALDLNMSLDDFNTFVSYLNEECSLINIEKDKITTDITQETLEKLMKERHRNKENYEKTQSQHVESKIKHVENIQSKVKESKGNKSKEKEMFFSGEKLVITQEQVYKIKEIYSISDELLLKELKIMDIWSIEKKRTHKKPLSFILNWLKKLDIKPKPQPPKEVIPV